MITYEIEQHSEHWYAARCGRVTGTGFKSLVAGESTATYKDLITTVAGEIITGEMEESYSNAIMQRGIDLEADARTAYENEIGAIVKEVGFVTPDYDNEFSLWIGISPDGLIKDDNGIIEIKCPIRKTHLNYIEGGKLPTDYKHQIQGQLFVTGSDYCDFVSYYPKMKLFIIRVLPDLELFETYRNRLIDFIEKVETKIKIYDSYEAIR